MSTRASAWTVSPKRVRIQHGTSRKASLIPADLNPDMQGYQTFIESKIKLAEQNGHIGTDGVEFHTSTKPHQNDSGLWALRRGRALIAASFGLGKTHIQIELAKAIHKATGLPFLVVCPLGVKHQFQEEDGPRLGVRWQYVRTDDELRAADTPFLITNYERIRDGNIDPRLHDLAGVSLDEGSCLRSLGSKTYSVFEEVFAKVPYRYVCTATPAPNNYRELIYYARFLGVMDSGQALTRWFNRNPEKAGDLRLHPQHENDFWLFVSSWALFLYRPSDLGYDDAGYELPELKIHYHRLGVDHRRAWEQTDDRGQRKMLLDAADGVQAAVREKRATMPERVTRMLEIVISGQPGTALESSGVSDQIVIWCNLNDEQRAVESILKEHGVSFSSIYGSLSIEESERRLYEWKDKRTSVLLSKAVMLGHGLNLQQCHKVIFLGIDYKFENFIQAIHRTYRFQQLHPVDVHIIYAESEDRIIETLQQKWQQHDELTVKMQEIVRKYGLSHSALRGELGRKIGVARDEVCGQLFTAVSNDCVLEMPNVADNSIGLIHTSIPFGNHYEYTTQLEDFGHNDDDRKFFKQMDYLIPDLYRVLKPGRVAAIHVKDRILYGHQTKSGFMEVEEFSDDTVKAFKRHGFLYEGRRTIVTDVVRENNSTYRLGWTEMTKDASKMGSGLPEYLLLFRKPPSANAQQYADEPVTKSKDDYKRGRWQVDAHSLWRSSGNRLLAPEEMAEMDGGQVSRTFTAEQLHTVYDHRRHVAICEALDQRGHLPSSYMLLPPKVTRDETDMVWDDVVYMRTLNTDQSRAHERNHICPMPLDIVERTVRLYSNPGDVVLDPFAGLFTVPVVAIQMGRYGHGIELSGDYFRAGVGYCQDMERKVTTPTLFDWVEQNEPEVLHRNGSGPEVSRSAQ